MSLTEAEKNETTPSQKKNLKKPAVSRQCNSVENCFDRSSSNFCGLVSFSTRNPSEKQYILCRDGGLYAHFVVSQGQFQSLDDAVVCYMYSTGDLTRFVYDNKKKPSSNFE